MRHADTARSTKLPNTTETMRRATAILTDPKIGYASREIRLAAWAILKTGRGQTVNQTRLNAMPCQGIRT